MCIRDREYIDGGAVTKDGQVLAGGTVKLHSGIGWTLHLYKLHGLAIKLFLNFCNSSKQ